MKFKAPADFASGSTMNGVTLATTTDLSNIPTDPDLNVYATTQDTTVLVYKQVDFKRTDGTLYARSILSNADINGNYQTLTYQTYDNPGTTVTKTKTWTLTYDSFGSVATKVVS